MNLESSASLALRTIDPLHVLLIEDNPEDAFTVCRNLARVRQPRFTLETAATWSDGRSKLELDRTDVVLLDLHLPDADGLPLVHEVVRSATDVPIVILTGVDDDQLAFEALQLGAQDYLVKNDLGTQTLRRSLCHAIERQQIAASLEQAHRERLQMKDEFLSHVSHELLTPLSAIYQFIEILDGTLGDATAHDKQRTCLDVLMRNAVALRRMIGDLMEATRLDTGKLQLQLGPFDLRGCLELAVHTAAPDAARKGLELTAEWSGDLPDVLADEERVRQVLGNLLSNAIKFTPAGGRIVIRSERWHEDPAFAHVRVQDTGYGIRSDALPHVFERLYQDHARLRVSRKGIGIGLYICREVIQALGGRIWVESQVDAGSTFHFTLPLYSLDRLLQTAVDPERSLALLTVELRAEEAHDATNLDAIGAELHALLSRLVWQECDRVLPRRRSGGRVEILAVLAQADALGAGSMRARIERAVTDTLATTDARIAVEVHSFVLYEPSTEDPGAVTATPDAIADQIDRVLEREEACALDRGSRASAAPSRSREDA